MKTVIVGGVAGGMSAATRLRRLDEEAEIVVFERSGHVSFANCGLPYYLGGVIPLRSALMLQTPASLGERFGLDVRTHHEVTAIDREAKTVTVRHVHTGAESVEDYDNLILAPGAAPFVPDIPGRARALALRTIEDTDALEAHIGVVEGRSLSPGGKHSAVVMGGGFIGLEFAENLQQRGWQTTIVELSDQIMSPLDPELAEVVQKTLEANGVRVLTNVSVTEITSSRVKLSDGTDMEAELVLASIGVRPETRLAVDAGLEVAESGGIVVDEYQRTSDPSIFAVGDAAVKRDAIDGSPAMIPLANPANRHGRLVADVIAGRDVSSLPNLGTAIVGVFGLQAAETGWNEKRARAEGREIRVIHTHPLDHAGYFPGAKSMSLKLVLDAQTDEILGAQGVGEAGIDKRVDVIATAMRGGLKASQLADLELSYAPQFGAAKDPVNMLGFIAENMATGLADTIQWHELEAELARGVQLVDVRTPREFDLGAIPGAVNIPLDELRERLDEVDDEVIITCQVGLRGYLAERILKQHGRSVRNLDGGYRTWARI